jgi:hypothetical protein
MVIDSSGNLLVGKTSSSASTTGAELQKGSGGQSALIATADGAKVGVINRTTSDGDLLEFRKDGSTVGSIGSYVNLPYIGKSDVTLLFDPAGPHMIPRGTNGGARDAAINLGSSSNRFKDLYLSGGVYLGGTGSANKLDDYETGTYQTSISPNSGGTVTLDSSYDELSYVKVGDIVHVQGYLSISSVSSPTGSFVINLPFTSKSGYAYRAAANLRVNQVTSNNVVDFWGIVDHNVSYIIVYMGDATGVQADAAQQLQAGTDFRIQVTYQVA